MTTKDKLVDAIEYVTEILELLDDKDAVADNVKRAVGILNEVLYLMKEDDCLCTRCGTEPRFTPHEFCDLCVAYKGGRLRPED